MSCCVVIPIYQPFSNTTKDEKASLLQAIRIFNKRQFFLVHPENLDIVPYVQFFKEHGIDLHLEGFKGYYFRSTISYSKLMLSPFFYRRFLTFDYILIYQTDAFVFEDKLEEWCDKDYSYVGAPWFKGFVPPECTDELLLVGNGGFSIRKVRHCLKALSSFSVIFSLKYILRSQLGKSKNSLFRNLAVALKRIFFGNNSFWVLNDFHRYNNDHNSFQEDYFWGVICKENFSWFKVPEPEEALRFSFEVQPEIMFAYNNNQLPMGCHAWHRHNPEFWKPYFSKFGYEM